MIISQFIIALIILYFSWIKSSFTMTQNYLNFTVSRTNIIITSFCRDKNLVTIISPNYMFF